MSAAELLYGTREPADLPPGAPFAPDRSAIELTDVEIYYSLFELPMASALPRLPKSLHPSIPAVLATSFWRVPDSPAGPFEFAYTGLACRTGIKPRHFVCAAWVDNPAAGTLLAQRYGLACAAADITSRETYDRIHGEVRVDGETVLEIVTNNMVALGGAGAVVKYSPALALAETGDGSCLVQFEAGYEFNRVLRGEVRAPVFDGAAFGEPQLRPATAIAGTFAVCDVHLMPARFTVDTAIPAEAGGAKKIERS